MVVSLGEALSDSEEDEFASLNEGGEPAEKRSSWAASSFTWLLSCGLNSSLRDEGPSWFCTQGVRAGGLVCALTALTSSLVPAACRLKHSAFCNER